MPNPRRRDFDGKREALDAARAQGVGEQKVLRRVDSLPFQVRDAAWSTRTSGRAGRARRDSRRPRSELTIRRRTPVERVHQRCSSPTFVWFTASMAFKCASESFFQPGPNDAHAPTKTVSMDGRAGARAIGERGGCRSFSVEPWTWLRATARRSSMIGPHRLAYLRDRTNSAAWR